MRRSNHMPLSFTSALYNWYAANYNVNGTSIANPGWHVPSYLEWQDLITYLGGWQGAGNKLKLQGRLFWPTYNTADNSTGFSGIAKGMRASNGTFQYLKSTTYYQLSSYNIYSSNGLVLQASLSDSSSYGCSPEATFKKLGFSVRLLKDDSSDPGSYTDFDGNVYATIKIGNQVWLKSSLKVKHYNDGTPITYVSENSAWSALTTEGFCFYNNQQIVH